MNKNFSVAEILESIDLVINDNRHNSYGVKKDLDSSKKFNHNKIIKMIDIKKKMQAVAAEKESILNKIKLNEKNLENKKNYNFSNLDSSQTLKLNKEIEPLILVNELTEEKRKEEPTEDEESIIKKGDLAKLEEENDIESLENNFVYLNEKLKVENIKKEEKIKDQEILLEKFLSTQRYIDLDKKIKLFQDDNALLRQKILKLSDNETSLRLKMSDQTLRKIVSENKNEKNEQATESNVIIRLNNKIDELSFKIDQVENKLFVFLKNKESQSMDIGQKIKFYREENAKIIVDKRDIERKLENTKNQLAINENNKKELKVALDNLNRILTDTNIESTTFINKIEEQEDNTNSLIDKNITKKPKK